MGSRFPLFVDAEDHQLSCKLVAILCMWLLSIWWCCAWFLVCGLGWDQYGSVCCMLVSGFVCFVGVRFSSFVDAAVPRFSCKINSKKSYVIFPTVCFWDTIYVGCLDCWMWAWQGQNWLLIFRISLAHIGEKYDVGDHRVKRNVILRRRCMRGRKRNLCKIKNLGRPANSEIY